MSDGFDRAIRLGLADAERRRRRMNRRLATGLGAALAAAAITAGLVAASRASVAEVSACQKAQEAASAEYDKTAAAFRELEQAVSMLDEGWDMDKAIPLSKTAPDEPAAWDCKVDPDGASARARSDAHKLRSERTRYEEAKR
mgnify:CR=1 FL=1